ncbi:hypothetical protein M4914_00930, partial [Streptomyces somaliensis DSM 40738]
AAWAG